MIHTPGLAAVNLKKIMPEHAAGACYDYHQRPPYIFS
jgi:hypothetical protein